MKTKEDILNLLNKFQANFFYDIVNELGHEVFTKEYDIEKAKDVLEEYDITDQDTYIKLKELNIEITEVGLESLNNRDKVQIVISIDNQLYATDGYYSSYDSDNYDNDWYIAEENIVQVMTYNPSRIK